MKQHFERDTLANKLFLKKQYFRKEMKQGHLKEMKEITDKLASVGAPISEEDQVVTLLGSLYSTLVTALEARGGDIRLDYVQQALIQEEVKRKGITANDGATCAPQDAALVGGQTREQRYWKPPVCWKCNMTGHIQRFCPK